MKATQHGGAQNEGAQHEGAQHPPHDVERARDHNLAREKNILDFYFADMRRSNNTSADTSDR